VKIIVNWRKEFIAKFYNLFPSLTLTIYIYICIYIYIYARVLYVCMCLCVYECDFNDLIAMYFHRCFLWLESVGSI